MTQDLGTTDVSRMPEILHLAEEVSASGRPRLLRRDGRDLAVVVPVGATGNEGAVLAAAGSWKGLVDAEDLKERIRDERGSRRSAPPL